MVPVSLAASSVGCRTSRGSKVIAASVSSSSALTLPSPLLSPPANFLFYFICITLDSTIFIQSGNFFSLTIRPTCPVLPRTRVGSK
jgi:hypothetical protein